MIFETENSKEKENEECTNNRCKVGMKKGDVVVMVQQVVLGLSRPIPQATPMFFHDDSCLANYFCQPVTEKLPRRVP